jgi:hypothetical protein
MMSSDFLFSQSTRDLFNELVSGGWQEVDLKTPGAVIVSPSKDMNGKTVHGHTGIVGENGVIYSNSSATGLWKQNWTVDDWRKHYAPCGCHAFVPPAQAAAHVETEQKPIGVVSTFPQEQKHNYTFTATVTKVANRGAPRPEFLEKTTNHHGPVRDHKIHPWLRPDAVAEFQALVGTIDSRLS